MRQTFLPTGILVGLAAVLMLGGGVSRARAAEQLKLEVLLVWATDDAKPPDGKDYKPLDPELRKQLKALKWKNYFLVRETNVVVSTAAPRKVDISDKCYVDIKALGNSMVEATLFGKGKEASKVKQTLPKGEILVVAGNAPNETAWLNILRRLE